MANLETNDDFERNPAQQFSQTHWSVVLSAAQTSSFQAAALETLCRTYWLPLYAYVRRKGHSPHDAQDLTQEFFARLLKNNSFAGADRQKGKFRTYLLGALNHFLADEWDKTRAAKRGGGRAIISLDDEKAEERYLQHPASDLPPDKIFARRWGLVLLEEALKRLREEFVAAGKGRQFELLKSFLTVETQDSGYVSIAAELETTTNTVAVSVHRLRQRYRELVRAEVAHTVADLGEVDEELRGLFSSLLDMPTNIGALP